MAMRSVLSFDINLGMFGFPVKVYKAMGDQAEDAVSFNQVHGKCGTRINKVNRCHACNVDVPYGDLVKGHEHEGKMYTFTDAEIKALKPESSGSLTVVGYVGAHDVDPAFQAGGVWFLAPGGKDATTFTTWRDALAAQGKWAIGKVVMYQKEHVVIIRPVEKVLMLHWVRTQSEFRDVHNIPGYAKVPDQANPEYVAAMSELVNAKQVEFTDVVFETDAVQDAVKALVKARIAGEAAPTPVQTAAPAQAVDLMAAIRASLAAG